MLHPVKSVIALGILVAAAACPAQASTDFWIGISPPPSPPRIERVPVPSAGRVWSPGYYEWTGRNHTWISGQWKTARPGYLWVPSHWEQDGYSWLFRHGHWESDAVHG